MTPNYFEFLPTAEQLTYTINCLQERERKIMTALEQVRSTITRLDILKEVTERETANGN